MKAKVYSWFQHRGEESCITGTKGSGTIFFSECNLKCVFCQNYELSSEGQGEQMEDSQLANAMIELQRLGCHNINLVSPTHVVAPFLRALCIAVPQGLKIPIVYNTGGYDSLQLLKILDGVIDIYMPDTKYSSKKNAALLSEAPGYPRINQQAITEMHRQVGDLKIDQDGLARRGLLIRHLVMPNNAAGSKEIFEFLSKISKHMYINIMAQYKPCHLVKKNKEFEFVNRSIDYQELQQAYDLARKYGLYRFDSETPRMRISDYF